MVKRKEVRQTFLIKGDDVEDCVISACCPCCALIQQEKEVVQRQHGGAGEPKPIDQTGYVPQASGMTMPQRPEPSRSTSNAQYGSRPE